MPRRASHLPEHDRIDLSGRSFRYRICPSERRRTVALRIDRSGELSVYAPDFTPLSLIRSFIVEKQRWISAKLAYIAEWASSTPALATGAALSFLGESLTLVVQNSGRAGCSRHGNILDVRAADDVAVRRVLETWYRHEAARYFSDRIELLAERVGQRPSRLSIRGQRSRWGSCSRRGTISLNWRLMQSSPAVVDYVIVHELCHLLVPNHSAQFWSEVSRVMPDWRDQRRALHAFGHAASL